MKTPIGKSKPYLYQIIQQKQKLLKIQRTVKLLQKNESLFGIDNPFFKK